MLSRWGQQRTLCAALVVQSCRHWEGEHCFWVCCCLRLATDICAMFGGFLVLSAAEAAKIVFEAGKNFRLASLWCEVQKHSELQAGKFMV